MADQDRRVLELGDDALRRSTVPGTVTASIGDGSARSASTSTSKPG